MKQNLKDCTFDRLTVLGDTGKRSPHRDILWLCECSCGKKVYVVGSKLKSGHTRSCGCLQRELFSAKSTTHGQRYTRLYRIWTAMKTRCTNPNSKDWPNYGGRGIGVCEKWLNDFSAFCEWALENGYADDLTIDRKNNDRGYCPENCRWATRAEQNQNKRPMKRTVRN